MVATRYTMQRYLRQGTPDFSVGYKIQTRWGAMEALIFTLECGGAALTASSILVGGPTAAHALGVGMVALAVLLLLLHLGHPARAWRAMLNVRTSWISRGTLVLGGFVGLGFLGLMLPAPALGGAIGWLLLAAAGFIVIYPGLILSASPAIPFWNSGLLPIFSAVNGAATGVLAFALTASMTGMDQAVLRTLYATAFWLSAGVGLVLFIYVSVMLRRGAAAAESASYLMRAHPLLFLGVGCVLGVVVPMALAYWMFHAGVAAASAAVAVLARLTGDFACRHAFLRVGMFNPVV